MNNAEVQSILDQSDPLVRVYVDTGEGIFEVDEIEEDGNGNLIIVAGDGQTQWDTK